MVRNVYCKSRNAVKIWRKNKHTQIYTIIQNSKIVKKQMNLPKMGKKKLEKNYTHENYHRMNRHCQELHQDLLNYTKY